MPRPRLTAGLNRGAASKLGEALGWAREQGLSTDGDLSYVREFEHITLARVLLARGAILEGRSLPWRWLDFQKREFRGGPQTGRGGIRVRRTHPTPPVGVVEGHHRAVVR